VCGIAVDAKQYNFISTETYQNQPARALGETHPTI